MTFLDLVRDLARETGTLAGGVQLLSTTGNAGRAEKMVSWVRKAWINIQNERADWPWMRREFTSALEAGKQRYTPADFGIDRFGLWERDRPGFRTFTIYDPAHGATDEAPLRWAEYETWKVQFARGAHDSNRPTTWAISPQDEFCIGNRPDKPYVITGEYRVSPQMLEASDDVPEMPHQYHGAIVWEAMRLLGMADESQATTASAIGEYVLARQNLNRDYLPEIRLDSRPLA